MSGISSQQKEGSSKREREREREEGAMIEKQKR
jgi:hypothetical protein